MAQRVCTSRGEMGGATLLVFFHVKLNLIDPCHTVRDSMTVEGCQAGGLGHLLQYICLSTMPRTQNRAGKGSILL